MIDEDRIEADSPSLAAQLRPELFRALADPTRLQLLCRLMLASGPQTVTEVSSCCGVHLSGVSRHLGVLRDAGVVSAAKEGREVRYSPEAGRITAALRGMADAIESCRERCETEGDSMCCPSPETLEKDA